MTSPIFSNDSLFEVFSYLSWKDLSTCQLVCKQWKEIKIKIESLILLRENLFLSGTQESKLKLLKQNYQIRKLILKAAEQKTGTYMRMHIELKEKIFTKTNLRQLSYMHFQVYSHKIYLLLDNTMRIIHMHKNISSKPENLEISPKNFYPSDQFSSLPSYKLSFHQNAFKVDEQLQDPKENVILETSDQKISALFNYVSQTLIFACSGSISYHSNTLALIVTDGGFEFVEVNTRTLISHFKVPDLKKESLKYLRISNIILIYFKCTIIAYDLERRTTFFEKEYLPFENLKIINLEQFIFQRQSQNPLEQTSIVHDLKTGEEIRTLPLVLRRFSDLTSEGIVNKKFIGYPSENQFSIIDSKTLDQQHIPEESLEYYKNKTPSISIFNRSLFVRTYSSITLFDLKSLKKISFLKFEQDKNVAPLQHLGLTDLSLNTRGGKIYLLDLINGEEQEILQETFQIVSTPYLINTIVKQSPLTKPIPFAKGKIPILNKYVIEIAFEILDLSRKI